MSGLVPREVDSVIRLTFGAGEVFFRSLDCAKDFFKFNVSFFKPYRYYLLDPDPGDLIRFKFAKI